MAQARSYKPCDPPTRSTRAAMSSMTSGQEFWLWVAHIVAGSGHLASAVTIVALQEGRSWSPALELSFERWIETPCPVAQPEKCYIQTRIVDTFSYSVVAVCAIFAAWSGAWHVVTAVPYGWKLYLLDIARGTSRFRWYDYLVSSSLMITVIAVFSGVVDVWTLLNVALLQAVVILMGQTSERMALPNAQWAWYYLSSLFYVAGVWLPLQITFSKSISTIPDDRKGVSTALIAGFVAFYVVYSSFAVVAFVNLRTRFRYYLGCEIAYIILSLVSKTLLHWVLFFSLLTRSKIISNDEFTPDSTENTNSNAVYVVIATTVLGGAAFAVALAVLWRKSKKNGPVVLTVDRNILKRELADALDLGAAKRVTKRAFHVQ